MSEWTQCLHVRDSGARKLAPRARGYRSEQTMQLARFTLASTAGIRLPWRGLMSHCDTITDVVIRVGVGQFVRQPRPIDVGGDEHSSSQFFV